ncbi:MAG: M48 family metalloprotease [Methanosarcinaceae archaeon]|nr:M48 family metalloprotease [Methanosarcinaceae archaeon]MDF1533780.1 M48 family metalloprotease [Methanosarcinaceae archaeon]
MSSIADELICYAECVNKSDLLPLISFLVVASLLLFAFYLKSKTPIQRVSSFAGAQLLMIGAIVASFSTMECSRMLTIEMYLAYVFISTGIMLFLPGSYYKILIRHHNAKPISEIVDWVDDFVNTLSEDSNVYYFDSAIPKAFASGKAIFVSIGMLELFDEQELKAVLAHEAWHLRHNNKTPILRQLSLMTFTKFRPEQELELMADRFAEKIVSKGALESARAKLI